ncbi:MAG: hypothetical protein IPJ77_17585 [Planctomycetes bacterium]|nr:hypothetical protein [Planctomycetota bacterium]
MFPPVHRSRAAALLVFLALGAGCKSLESKTWNLSQLHDDGSRHRYHGALQSDFEYVLRHDVAGVLRGAGARFAEKGASGIDDPSQRCLENLVDLERYPAKTKREEALRVEWLARLAVACPSRLSRERAALALGPIGATIEAGVPVGLAKDAETAGAAVVSNAAAALVRAVRGAIDPKALQSEGGPPAPTIDAACVALEALVLDLDGARRALAATGELATVRGLGADARARIEQVSLDLERRLVRQALASALKDPEPIVRAAAVEASVACAGLSVVDSMILHFEREQAPEVVVRVLALVRRRGLPDAPATLEPRARAEWRDRQLQALYALLVTRPESEVHVAAMLALSRVADAGFQSLREEDWQAWFQRRRSSPATVPADTKPSS